MKIATFIASYLFLTTLAPAQDLQLNYENVHGGHLVRVGGSQVGYHQVDQHYNGRSKIWTEVYVRNFCFRAPVSVGVFEYGAAVVVLFSVFLLFSARRGTKEGSLTRHMHWTPQ